MSPEQWRRVEALYHSALECPPEQRRGLLEKACASDEDLRSHVESLLDQTDSTDSVLERPVWERMPHLASGTFTRGSLLGPYRIEGPLGAGGMGEVFAGVDTRLGRKVAIKVSTQPFSGRLDREARAISALNHPHICTLYDIGPNYLVMELVEGETLEARLQKGLLPLDLVLRYAGEIADALAAAHALEITHRDLKPGNIMVTSSGIKVLDFGLAKFAAHGESRPAETTVTEKGAIMGTVQYMAPEQLEGKKADARSDIFALGIVIHEMATGHKTFASQSRAGIIAEILRSDPPSISSSRGECPPLLDLAVARCLAKKQGDRWQSAQDLAAALRWTATAANVPLIAPPRAIQKTAWTPWLIAAAGVVAAAGLALTSIRRPVPEPPLQRFTIPLPRAPGQIAQRTHSIAVSPDGRYLAYTASTNPSAL